MTVQHSAQSTGRYFTLTLPPPPPPRAPTSPLPRALYQCWLLTCHLPCRRLVLPPTCTRVVPSASWTSRAKQLFTLPSKKKGKSSKAKAAKGAAATGQESNASVAGAEEHHAGEAKPEEGKSEEQQLSRQVCHLEPCLWTPFWEHVCITCLRLDGQSAISKWKKCVPDQLGKWQQH